MSWKMEDLCRGMRLNSKHGQLFLCKDTLDKWYAVNVDADGKHYGLILCEGNRNAMAMWLNHVEAVKR